MANHYLVQVHTGGYYWSDRPINHYCEQCGDSDSTVLEVDDQADDALNIFCEMLSEYIDVQEAVLLIKEINMDGKLLEQMDEVKKLIQSDIKVPDYWN